MYKNLMGQSEVWKKIPIYVSVTMDIFLSYSVFGTNLKAHHSPEDNWN